MAALAAVLALAAAVSWQAAGAAGEGGVSETAGAAALVDGPPVATFSIVGWDEETGDLGVAVASRFLGVGAVVPWAEAGVGAVATQAYANPAYGPDGLALMRDGVGAEEVVRRLTQADAGRARRQVGMVDAQGRPAAFTGEGCMRWAGHRTGRHCAAQGNILAGEEVVEAMVRTFEETDGALPERLLAALAAGEAAGGDRRGKQSAALLVVREGGGYAGGNDRWVDLRVDDHADPIPELRRIAELHRRIFRRDERPPRRDPDPDADPDEPAEPGEGRRRDF